MTRLLFANGSQSSAEKLLELTNLLSKIHRNDRFDLYRLTGRQHTSVAARVNAGYVGAFTSS